MCYRRKEDEPSTVSSLLHKQSHQFTTTKHTETHYFFAGVEFYHRYLFLSSRFISPSRAKCQLKPDRSTTRLKC